MGADYGLMMIDATVRFEYTDVSQWAKRMTVKEFWAVIFIAEKMTTVFPSIPNL